MKKQKFEVGMVYKYHGYKVLCTKRTNYFITFDVYKNDQFLWTEKRKIKYIKKTYPTSSNTASDFMFECVRIKYFDEYRKKYCIGDLDCDMYAECDQNLNNIKRAAE